MKLLGTARGITSSQNETKSDLLSNTLDNRRNSRHTHMLDALVCTKEMQYVEFRDCIQKELCRHPKGVSWAELKERLHLPYRRPCPSWIRRMENEVGLSRMRTSGQGLIWSIAPSHGSHSSRPRRLTSRCSPPLTGVRPHLR